MQLSHMPSEGARSLRDNRQVPSQECLSRPQHILSGFSFEEGRWFHMPLNPTARFPHNSH